MVFRPSRGSPRWISTPKGLASWKDGKLTHYGETAGQNVETLLEDRGGTVWVGTYADPSGRLCAIRNDGTQCYGEDGTLGYGVFSLYEDSRGNLWAGATTGLWRWKPGPRRLYAGPNRPTDIIGLTEGDNGVVLINMKGGLRQLVNGKVEPYPLLAGRKIGAPGRLLRDHNGGLWVATQGESLLHVHQGRTDVFAQSDGLSSNLILSLFEDREGNIWVATLDGLDRFRDFAVPTVSVKQGLSNANVRSVLRAWDNRVWLGTLDGLNRWSDGQITIYRKRNGLADDLIESLFQDDHGRIWVSTRGGVAYFENGRFIPAISVPRGFVTSITGDNAGNLWVGDELRGLFHLVGGNLVEQIPWAKAGVRHAARSLAADPSRGGLWLGSFSGGVAYFKDGHLLESYGITNGLGEGRVEDLQLERDGTLWAATEGGLSRIKNGRVTTLNSKNGLPCDTVHWSMEDNEHSVWLYMACGLVRIGWGELDAWGADPKRIIQAAVFDSSDGVRSHSRSNGLSPSVAKTADGELWFLPGDGVSVIDPRHLPINNVPPPVHVEQIIADGKTYWQNLYGDAPSSPPKLPPLVRDLTIDYTALSLVVPEKVHFRYKLEGWDRDWQDAGTRRQAFYTNLAPRNYRFRVMACNNSGVWNEAGGFLDFSVAPAYYQTSWFRLSCVAAFLALLWGLYQLRLQQLAREFNAGLEARVNERTRIARELHDSLLQGFQGLMFRLQAVRDLLPGRASEAMQALDTALERGDKAIAEGRDTVSDLREPIMGDSDIGQALTALGKELAPQSGNGLVPCVRVLLEGKQRELNPMLRDEIYRIAREALRNAFRHAKAEKIEAEITFGDSEFLLHVRDDGSGIDPAFANQGSRAGHWGLPGMRERAKSFGGKLEVWSEHGAGTEIELSVPAAIAYGKSEPRRRFWLWRKKIGESDGQHS